MVSKEAEEKYRVKIDWKPCGTLQNHDPNSVQYAYVKYHDEKQRLDYLKRKILFRLNDLIEEYQVVKQQYLELDKKHE